MGRKGRKQSSPLDGEGQENSLRGSIDGQVVHIIEDGPSVGEPLALLLKIAGLDAELYPSAMDFLKSERVAGCVVSDVHMPGMGGLELLEEMKKRRIPLPVILTTARADVLLAVKAMKLGAFDFIEKPFDDELMISSVREALALRSDEAVIAAREKLEKLTSREKDVLAGVLKGKINKTIANELGVSVRTVETHRANLMAKAGVRSISELIRMALLAEWTEREA